MVRHGQRLVIVVGEEPPVMSVAFGDPEGAFSGFSVIYSGVTSTERAYGFVCGVL